MKKLIEVYNGNKIYQSADGKYSVILDKIYANHDIGYLRIVIDGFESKYSAAMLM